MTKARTRPVKKVNAVASGATPDATGFLPLISAPARRALDGAGIKTLSELSHHTEAEILALHGMGPNAMGKLRAALEEAKMSFRKK